MLQTVLTLLLAVGVPVGVLALVGLRLRPRAQPSATAATPTPATPALEPTPTPATPEPASQPAAEALAGQIAEALAEARADGRREAAEILARAERQAGEALVRAERTEADLATQRERVRVERDAATAARQQAEQAARETTEQARQAAEHARESAQAEADALLAQARARLAEVAGLTPEQARATVVAEVERDARREALATVRRIEAEAQEEAEARAREIVGLAVQRVASGTTTETVVQAVPLPSEDYKGRIIGREGRNIRAFEQVTGVNVLIDDTPEMVLLSCFDPVRREIGRLTLEALLADGRVHPQRIEEQHARSADQVAGLIRRAAQDAMTEAGIHELDDELVTLLGRLRYRTSYGQNVLAHLVETAHIASGMAHELHLPPRGIEVVRRGAFLHDLGKAVSHEVEGSHALVGADLARRHGEDADVVHAIEAHHQEVAPRTLEAWLTIASDSCSGGRPGARRESLEAYLERLSRIEAIAQGHAGVDRVFAMSAGRELRVMVLPDQVDDTEAQLLARDIARQVEDELTYPGQIRVTVIRESRATETAH